MPKILIGKYEATIYPERGGYTGAISLGFDGRGNRQRIKKKGRTKAAVRDKLVQVVADREAGLKPTVGYTVADAVNDWLTKGLKGRDDNTVTTNRILAEQHLIPLIGATKLKEELTADAVDEWLDGLTDKLSTRSLQGVHAILKRAIRQAQARGKVLANVAQLVTTPKGKEGRPSKAMTLEQATAILEQAKESRLHAYVVVSVLTGIRTEEARALRWSHVVAWTDDGAAWMPVAEAGFDHDRFAIYVWRSVRANGDTKTEKSRRTLELPAQAAEALREHRSRQAKERLATGPLWQDHGLVFASQVGTPLDVSHVRRAFKAITRKAGLGANWTPRELRHTFVSPLAGRRAALIDLAAQLPAAVLADLLGLHPTTAVTWMHQAGGDWTRYAAQLARTRNHQP